MNDVQNVTMQTPIEIALQIDEDGMTTARNLYEFLELGIGQFLRWAKTNIENNEFYEEGKDWWGFDIVSSGNKCKDYRLSTDFAKHLCMESHSQKGKIARKYFVDVEDKAKQLVINRAQLSPQMQMFYSIADGQAKLELEQKRQAEQLARAEEKANKALENVEAIKESVRPVSEHWREDVNNKFNKIQRFAGITYNNLRGDMYEELEKRAGCSLNTRLRNKRSRMEDSGCTKTQINNLNKMDIIEEDKKLREIFAKIITEYEIRYCI